MFLKLGTATIKQKVDHVRFICGTYIKIVNVCVLEMFTEILMISGRHCRTEMCTSIRISVSQSLT